MLTLALLIAFGAPSVAPIFAATPDSQASLPACCRTHGKHHCSMRMLTTSSTPAFQAPPCPLYPAAAQQSRIGGASLSAPGWSFVAVHRDSAPLISRQGGAQIAAASAHLNRGPPSRFA